MRDVLANKAAQQNDLPKKHSCKRRTGGRTFPARLRDALRKNTQKTRAATRVAIFLQRSKMSLRTFALDENNEKKTTPM